MKKPQRTYIPGSNWLYFKIYAGEKTMDRILAKNISTIISKLIKDNLITKWFFIRYADPESHIRIRFLIKDITQIGGLMNVVYSETQKLVCHNQVWKIQVDTYNRELERYGFNLINEVESIFHKDSECVLSIIKKINLSKKEDYRWMIALRMIDSLLSDFGYEISTKLKLIETLNKSFKKEFGFNKQNSKQLK